MTVISALQNVHVKGSFGNFENKSENELLKIKELKNLLIVQIFQYKNSLIKIDDINFNNLKFVNQAQKVVSNENLYDIIKLRASGYRRVRIEGAYDFR